MIRKALIGALLAGLACPAFAGPISAYPAASTLTGAETMISTQGGATVNVSPNQIAAFIRAGANIWATTQTFSVAPVFVDQPGTRTALGLGSAALISAPVSVSNGGTSATTLTAHGVVLGEGTSAVAITSAGVAAQCLLSGGAAADPSFGSCGGLSAITANSALANNTAGSAVPVGVALPSCSAAASALTWTTNTGFGCNTIAGGGTVTTTGTPANGNLTKFSGATSIVNGDLSGDCTTSGTLGITCTKTNTVAFSTAATASFGTAANTVAQGNDSRFNGPTQNSQSANYTFVLADAGAQIYHPSADTTARTWTIPANGSVAYGVSTKIEIVNDCSAGVITLAITTDTLTWFSAGTTGTRTIAACGMATLTKVTSTKWVITGVGVT